MTKPEKMALTSMDVAEEKREELKRCLGSEFPEVFGEGAIDFEQLRRVLGDWVEPGKERFGLNWPGKAECMKIIQQPSVATLKPVREESLNFNETGNLFIEGDNLEVLKLLQKAYFGKIKMIYIDPPYNTGKEFIYPDKYSETLDTYLAYTGQIDDEGKKFSTNTDTTGRFHSRWLNMMYPRLYLARNLLKENGAIFISIDDNEALGLRAMCDLIFGEENFVGNIVWQKTYSPANDKKGIDAMHDYIICYQKSETFHVNLLPRTRKQDHAYTNPDDDPRGPWKAVDATRAEHRDYAYFPITTPSGKEVFPAQGRSWVFNKEELPKLITDNRLWFGKDGSSKPSKKLFLSEVKQGVVPTTWWSHEGVGHNDEAKKELKKLMPEGNPFDTPKPTRLIQRILQITTEKESSDIILDFFAGSATTAHAVMEMNRQDGGDRRFLLTQLPEKISDESEMHKADFRTVSDIGKERIHRVVKSISAKNEDELDLDGRSEIDLGLMVFRLDRSNFKTWEGDAGSFDKSGKQLEMHVDHLSPESSAEDVLYELLLKAGFPLTTKVKQLTLAGKQVFSIEDGALLICLEKEITPELIDALAEAEPLQVICLDAAFNGNDQLKANAVQTFKARAQAEESEIVFRTV